MKKQVTLMLLAFLTLDMLLKKISFANRVYA